MTFACKISQIIQDFINLPVNTNILHISDLPEVHQDKQLQEFLRGKICCQNFINQDLTFLQPSVLHGTQLEEATTLQEAVTTEVLSLTPQEDNSQQESNSNNSQISSAEVLYNRNRGNNRAAPMQPVEPVVGLTSEE